jgi:hypothetical protein
MISSAAPTSTLADGKQQTGRQHFLPPLSVLFPSFASSCRPASSEGWTGRWVPPAISSAFPLSRALDVDAAKTEHDKTCMTAVQ